MARLDLKSKARTYEYLKSIYQAHCKKYKLDLTIQNKNYMSRILETMTNSFLDDEKSFWQNLKKMDYYNAMAVLKKLYRYKIRTIINEITHIVN